MMPPDIPGAAAHHRVSMARCRPCANPNDSDEKPKCVLAGLTQYVLNNFANNSPL